MGNKRKTLSSRLNPNEGLRLSSPVLCIIPSYTGEDRRSNPQCF